MVKSFKRANYQLSLKLVSGLVFGVGLLLIIEVLFARYRRVTKTADALFVARISQAAPLIIGLSFVYLSLLLRRRKRAAWFISTFLFSIYLIVAAINLSWSDIALAAVGLYGLVKYRKEFVVKSGIYSSWIALRNAIIVLLIMVVYGIIGFLLLDKSAFGREISFSQSLDNTIDAFRLFGKPLKPLTIEGKLFLDSLYIVSFMTYAYIIITLFGPIKERFVDQTTRREFFSKLFKNYSKDSEDYFKLWPHDKHYFIKDEAGLAYKVVSGVALVAGDPLGKPKDIEGLISSFIDQCRINGWLVAFVNIDNRYLDLYKNLQLDIQKLGEEAIIDLDDFANNTIKNKHFRNICNRFKKLGYKAELISPPHSKAMIEALKRVSDSWLALPGKTERSFMLGYFDSGYLKNCPILIVRDSAKQIVGFLNQVPTKTYEANVDLMRHLADATPNLNDFMFTRLLLTVRKQGFKTVNLGLCPLAGISTDQEDKSALTNGLKFIYQNGNRFFGFSGLERFKKKFDPEWKNRYVAYQDGVVGFTRSMMAVNKAMQIKITKTK